MKQLQQQRSFVKQKRPKAAFCKWHQGKIAPLQDAVDLGIATNDEKAQLDEWKKYRVLVNRVDTSNPDWPEKPASRISRYHGSR
ncbi:tail fiber assembly protein [Salmonella enterica]